MKKVTFNLQILGLFFRKRGGSSGVIWSYPKKIVENVFLYNLSGFQTVRHVNFRKKFFSAHPIVKLPFT